MIVLTNITLQRGRENLLEKTSLTIYESRKVALIGRNGCGKSSLFELLLGKITPEEGDVAIPSGCRIAHMAQEVTDSQRTALDYVLDGHTQFRATQAAIDEAEKTNDHQRLSKNYETMEVIGGFQLEHQAAQLLHGLGFANEELSNVVTAFSGGWRIRLNLAQALMSPSDVLLLDEPTNHLDLDTTFWLEQWLKRYPGTLIIISHDRDFIDNVAKEIVHIETKKLHLYKGNYSGFERQRSEKLALQQANFDKQQRQIKHIQSFITRFKAKASKARQAQSRIKQLSNMEMVASVQIDSPFKFEFADNEKMSNPLITLRGIELGYGQEKVLDDIGLNLHPGARIGLLGVNGAGKSTLIKGITGDLAPFSGEIVKGEHCYIGYFAQHQLEALDLTSSAVTHIQRISPQASEQQIRNFLGGFDFHGDKAMEPIAPFSGGEKARLALAIIVWQKPNVLLLDEPTNHLDLDMRSALTLALQGFTGALIVVSHDRHLLRHSVDEYLLIHQGKVNPFDGTLEDYHRWISKGELKAGADIPQKPPSDSATKTNKKQQRRQTADIRKVQAPIKNRIKRIEQKIEQTQKRLKLVETDLGDDSIYKPEKKSRLEDLIFEQTDLRTQIESLEENWLLLNEQLETKN